ncbi:MAG: Minf_1886 family protein [Rubripirellula sp.]
MKSPLQAMRDLLAEDTRYKIEAYQFIRESLQFAHENMPDPVDIPFGESGDDDLETDEQVAARHVTGQQLCESCRQYALQQYGYLAKMVLANWGVHRTGDFGDLVYNLIRIEQMRKSETDRREDFDDVYSFEDAFEPEFEFIPKDED